MRASVGESETYDMAEHTWRALPRESRTLCLGENTGRGFSTLPAGRVARVAAPCCHLRMGVAHGDGPAEIGRSARCVVREEQTRNGGGLHERDEAGPPGSSGNQVCDGMSAASTTTRDAQAAGIVPELKKRMQRNDILCAVVPPSSFEARPPVTGGGPGTTTHCCGCRSFSYPMMGAQQQPPRSSGRGIGVVDMRLGCPP